ncbi:MAG: hypothetical protein NW226_26295 [Microscillaceae bacterium]|nr:hypothetical protein [Microscillaceae bacterium]
MEKFSNITSTDQHPINDTSSFSNKNSEIGNIVPMYLPDKEEKAKSKTSNDIEHKKEQSTLRKSSSKIEFPKIYSTIIQSWRGHITEINDDFFVAELEDLINQGTTEIAEFDFGSVSPDDLQLIKLGSVFYWNITKKMNRGQLTKESYLRFQRVILWDEEDYDNASDKAAELFNTLKFD